MEEWHATQDKLLGRSLMGLTTLAKTMMDVQLSHQRTAEAWKAAAKKWRQDVQEQTEKVMAVMTEAIEDAHIQATSYMLSEVEEARKSLQLIRDKTMHGRIDSFKKEMEHKARIASIEQSHAQKQVRERAKRVELETLKAHVLTMWNRMCVSLQDRAQWLLHAEGEIRGDHDSRPTDELADLSSVNHHNKLIKLYESFIEEAEKQQSSTSPDHHAMLGAQEDGGSSGQKGKVSQKWRRRSLYGVDTIALRLPLPNDQRRQADHARAEGGMAPSAEPIL